MRDAFDSIARSLDPAMIVVTAAAEDDDERGGCLVGFHAQSSIGPGRYSFWLSKANHTYRVSTRSSRFGIHFLDHDDMELAERFGTWTADERDKFAGMEVDIVDGVPVLVSCPHRLLVRKVAVLDEGGDHVCVTSEPLSATTSGPFRPLRLSDVEHLEPGHAAEDDIG